MWPSTLTEIGGMSKTNPFVVVMQIAENSAYKHSDYVVSLPSMAQPYMEKHGLKKGRFVNIRNGVVLEDWENPSPLPAEHLQILTELKKDKFIVGYFGGHALSNALDTLLDSAKELKYTDIHIVLVGDGVEKPRLVERSNNEDIENVTFLPSVPKKAVPSLVSFFDCTYVGALDSPLYRFGICPNKIFDSMMAGKPIVCAINTPDTLITDHRCGVMVKAGVPTEIAEAFSDLRNTPVQQLQIMGENGKKAALEHYNYASLAKQFEKLFLS